MFLHVSVILFTGGEGSASMCAGIPPPQSRPPRVVHAGRYGVTAGGKYPTGMHSCLQNFVTEFSENI